MNLAPVILFAYNRPAHTKKTVEALARNQFAEDTELTIYSDGAKPGNEAAVLQLREYLPTIQGFKKVSIVERPQNLGLAQNIISGVEEALRASGTVIVLEDDMITSPYFLQYMNEGLELYRHEEKVASIHGYLGPLPQPLPESFFLKGADCWGWGTWRRAWSHFEPNGEKLLQRLLAERKEFAFDLDGSYPYTQMLRDQITGRNNSWAIRWHASAYLDDLLTLHPGRSLVINTGGDGTGTHLESAQEINGILAQRPIRLEKLPLVENAEARTAMAAFYHQIAHPGLVPRIRLWISKIKTRLQTKSLRP